jgi:hypothetical protein
MRRSFSSLLLSLTVALLSAIAAIGAESQPTTELFTDNANGYSIRYPVTWKREPTGSAPGPGVTLFLSTPDSNHMLVSIYPLPTRVARYSSALFDKIGHDHVDMVLSGYRQFLKLNQILREQPKDRSDDQSMIFWQGTSAIDTSMHPWALVSEHVIRYGSKTMINVIYLGSKDVEKEGANVDRVMDSLSFTAH